MKTLTEQRNIYTVYTIIFNPILPVCTIFSVSILETLITTTMKEQIFICARVFIRISTF